MAASTIVCPGPASGALPCPVQLSEPDQVTGSPGNSAPSRWYSAVVVARSSAAGPVRTPDDPIQANESAVTPAPGRPASTNVTVAPARAAWYATDAPTIPAPTTITSRLICGLNTFTTLASARAP